MAVAKKPGDVCTVTLSFQHRGGGGSFDVGIGLAPAGAAGQNNVTDWFAATKAIPAHASFTAVTQVIQFTWPTNYASGNFDALKFIQTAGGLRDPGGNGFKLADWDQDVYSQAAAVDEFSSLTATYA